MKLINILAYTVLAAAPLTALQASGQGLRQEITVEHDIVPEKREAHKLPLAPAVTLPPVAKSSLSIISKGVGITLNPAASLLGPAASGQLAPDTTSLGYASLGYFPLYNLEASAGIRGRRANLAGGAWMQFDGYNYSRSNPLIPGYDSDYRRNTMTGGLYGTVGTPHGVLGASAVYTGDWYRAPEVLDLKSQSFEDFGMRIGFDSPLRRHGVTWNAAFRFGTAGYGHNSTWPAMEYDDALNGRVREGLFALEGNASAYTSDNSVASVGLSFEYQRDNRRTVAIFDPAAAFGPAYRFEGNEGGHSIRLFTINPGWRVSVRQFTATIGARMQFTGNSGKVFHIAPDVVAAWTPSTQFALYGKAGGGEHLNTLRDIHHILTYAPPMMGYDMSHVPVTFEAGIKAGPWSGMAVSAYVRYASANDWLMPVALADGVVGMQPFDMRGALFGAEASYRAGRTASATVRYERSSGQKADRGWYLWRDRARQSFEVTASVRPVEPLTVSASWTWRDRRRLVDSKKVLSDGRNPIQEVYSSVTGLGAVSDLSIDADWALDSKWNVWMKLGNLMGRHWQEIGFVPARGVNGLVGVSCKF